MKKLLLMALLSLFPSLALPMAEKPEGTPCVPAGCSGELCVPQEEAARTASTCIMRPEYECYQKLGRCEMQADGSCGWTQSYDLRQCLNHPERYFDDLLPSQPDELDIIRRR